MDSHDWAEMLFRMYLRWAERRGSPPRSINRLGRSAARARRMIIRGEYAFGYLKVERGVHRLVRISLFDAQKRAILPASVFVYAEADEEVELEIAEGDLRWDTFRASGAGGQHVNKTSSAVRVTHVPTGTVVQCQVRAIAASQSRHRALHLEVAFVCDLSGRKAQGATEDRGQGEIAWGNQIRSYVFQPYTMVKDHRMNLEIGDAR